MVLFVRELTEKEVQELHLLLEDDDIGYRAKIILLSNDGYAAPEIREMTNHHDINIRKWIHRFNEKGIEGIKTTRKPINGQGFTEEQRNKIVEIVKISPRNLGLKFGTWSLRKLAWYLVMKNFVEKISHEEIRQILLENNIRFRRAKKVMHSTDPEYALKKTSFRAL